MGDLNYQSWGVWGCNDQDWGVFGVKKSRTVMYLGLKKAGLGCLRFGVDCDGQGSSVFGGCSGQALGMVEAVIGRGGVFGAWWGL